MIKVPLTKLATRVFFILAVPLVLALCSVRLLLSYDFLQFEYQRPGFPTDAYGFSTDDRLEYGPIAISYLFNGEPLQYLANQRLPLNKCWQPPAGAEDCPLFNATELRHMSDVKHITGIVFGLALVFGIVAIALVAVARGSAQQQRVIRASLRTGSVLTLAIVVAVATLAFTTWDRAFDLFHMVFFAEGTWRFPFSDSLIRLYPEQLFVDAAIALAGFCALGAFLALFILTIWDKRAPQA